MELKDYIQVLAQHLKGMWRYRWTGLLMAVLLAVIGWVSVATIPDYYRATANVYIDTQTLIQPLMKDITVTIDPDERVRKMTRMLLSRPNLERIARMSDLDLEYYSRAEKEDFLKALEHDIKFRQSGNTNLYKISYENPEPNVAKLVVQSILTLFMELTLSDTRTDTVVAQHFIDDQLEQYRQKLVDAEQRLADFKRKHIDHLPRQDQTYYDNLQNYLGQLENTELELTIAKGKQKALEKEIRGESPIFGLTQKEGRQMLHPLIRELRAAQDKEEQLKQYYTEHHPDVIHVKQEIDRIKARIDHEQEDERVDVGSEDLNQNPVYQQLKIQLSEANTQIAALEAQRDEIKRLSDLMVTKVDQIIDAEAKLSNLNRDYLINKHQFNALLQKREAAKMAEDIDDSAENLKFRVIDPTFVSSLPVWPKRGLFELAVLLAAMVGGLATTWILTQIRPAFYDRVSIERTFHMPVLATISWERSVQEMKSLKRQHTYFTSGVLALIAFSIMLYLMSGGVAVNS